MSSLLQQLKSLRLGVTPYGKAPHKPVLLMAVIDGFEKGYLFEQLVPDLSRAINEFS